MATPAPRTRLLRSRAPPAWPNLSGDYPLSTIYSFGTGLRYLINEYLFAGLRLSRIERTSTLSSVEYTDHRATAYVGFKLCCTGSAIRQRGGP